MNDTALDLNNWLGEAERIRHWLKNQSNHWQSFVVFVDEEKLRPGCLKSHYKQLGWPEKKKALQGPQRNHQRGWLSLSFLEKTWENLAHIKMQKN